MVAFRPSTSGTSRKTSVVQRHILDITLEERRSRLAEQAKNNPYHRFVEGHLILKQGLIDKRKGLFARTRMFLLTEGPYLYYVDPANMEYKGQIPWSVDMRPEAKNFKTFFVHTVCQVRAGSYFAIRMYGRKLLIFDCVATLKNCVHMAEYEHTFR